MLNSMKGVNRNAFFLSVDLSLRRSEGLQTTRVLAPISKHAMQWTPGFPTKVRTS